MNHHDLDLQGITILLPIIKFVIGNYIEVPKIIKTLKGGSRNFQFCQVMNLITLWAYNSCIQSLIEFFLKKIYNL